MQSAPPNSADAAQTLVLGIGEVLWDNFAHHRRPGGAPANVAYHARQLGLDSRILSRIGNDADGAALRAYLKAHGLNCSALQVDADHPTGTVTVHTHRTTGPAYTIHTDVAWDRLEWTPEWEQLCSAARFICFGTLAQREPDARDTIRRSLAAAHDAVRVYDVNLRPPFVDAEIVRTSAVEADVIKLNDAEVAPVSAKLGLKGDDAQHLADALLSQPRCRYVCITQGADGCTVFTRDGATRAPGLRVRVADTVGSGDAFTAGFIYGLWRGWPTLEIARFANTVGACVAKYTGAMPPVRTTLARLLRTRFAK